MRTMRAVPGVLMVLPALCGSGCEGTDDWNRPEVRWVYPQDGDTLDPGAYNLKVVSTDDVAMRWVSFWAWSEMLGIVRSSRADTYMLGVDCRSDTNTTYPLGAWAMDRSENQNYAGITVYVRRAKVLCQASHRPGSARRPR
jgi:hypothetical protein